MAIGLLILSTGLLAQESVAVIVKLKGTVQVTPPNSQKSSDARKGTILKDGDRLETGAASFCAIKFLDDKSLLRLKENASCVIEGKRDGDVIDKNIFVEVGAFFASLFKQRGEFKVTTPTSVASVKGTKYWVIQLGRSGPTRFVIDEGDAVVQGLEMRTRTGELDQGVRSALIRQREALRQQLRALDAEGVHRQFQYVQVGNGVFMGGFYSTRGELGPGCSFTTVAHDAHYHDYSTGFRCCRDAEPQ